MRLAVHISLLFSFGIQLMLPAQDHRDSLQKLFSAHRVVSQTKETFMTDIRDSLVFHSKEVTDKRGNTSMFILFNSDGSINQLHRRYYNSDDKIICDSAFVSPEGLSYRREYSTYDASGSIASFVRYEGNVRADSEVFAYDTHHHWIRTVSFINNHIDTVERAYRYDPQGRMISSENDEQQVYYLFDHKGNCIEDSGKGREHFHNWYVYNKENRLIEKRSLSSDRETSDTTFLLTTYDDNGNVKSTCRIYFDRYYSPKNGINSAGELNIDTIVTVYSTDSMGNPVKESWHYNRQYSTESYSRSYFVYNTLGRRTAHVTQFYPALTLKEPSQIDSTFFDPTGSVLAERSYSRYRLEPYEVVKEKRYTYDEAGLLVKTAYYTKESGYSRTETLYTYVYEH